jgi:copper chaperone CopZ
MKSFTTLFILLLFAASAFGKDAKTEIKVSGMTCGACSVSVESALTKVKGVKSADVSTKRGSRLLYTMMNRPTNNSSVKPLIAPDSKQSHLKGKSKSKCRIAALRRLLFTLKLSPNSLSSQGSQSISTAW